jgi:NADH-quinone oxidoreductase subunit C
MNDRILEKLRGFAPESIAGAEEFRGDLTMVIRKEDIVRVASFLRDEPGLAFDLLKDLCGVDMLRPDARYEVVYTLYSLETKTYLRLKVRVEEEDPVVPTVTGVWAGADWHERETYDMFGIKFSDHPDLRRLYMPEDFEHHPLRKDFPLMGIPDSLPLPRR